MTIAEIVTVVFVFLLSAAAFVLGGFQWAQKGPLLNNAWIYASEKERAEMDKKPHYRQSAVVFFLLGGVFLTDGFYVLTDLAWFRIASFVLIGIALIFVVVSSVVTAKKK